MVLTRTRRSLFLWSSGILCIFLLVVSAAYYFATWHIMDTEIASEQSATADALAQYVSAMALPRPMAPTTCVDDRNLDDNHEAHEMERLAVGGTFYIVFNAEGQVVLNPRQLTDSQVPDFSVLDAVRAGQRVVTDRQIGGSIPVRLYSVPVYDPRGNLLAMVQVGADMTTHERQVTGVLWTTGAVGLVALLVALVAAYVLTHRALIPVRDMVDRQRAFVADASHELRAPLSVVRANIELMTRRNPAADADTAEILNDVQAETEHMTQLVTDMLTLARSDAGELEYAHEPVDLVQLGQALVRQMQPLASAKNLDLTFSAPHANEIWMQGDPARLRQLLVILLDNALKYTAHGYVHLNVERGHGQHVVIMVSDSGAGIEAPHLPHIFDRFYRADSARSPREGSTGLGLAIASEIVKAHGGTIRVTSGVGQGTSFSVTLPTHMPSTFNQP